MATQNKEFGKVDVESLKHMKLYRADFVSAFEDVTPSFGVQEADFKDCTQNGIVTWDSDIEVSPPPPFFFILISLSAPFA
jgi:hypothetical protein